MRDLRETVCLTVDERARCRLLSTVSRRPADIDVSLAMLDTLDVAVAALRSLWFTFLAEYRSIGEPLLRQRFCDMHNLTLPQAEALGIFGEGT